MTTPEDINERLRRLGFPVTPTPGSTAVADAPEDINARLRRLGFSTAERPLSAAPPTTESIHTPSPAGETGGASSPPPVEPFQQRGQERLEEIGGLGRRFINPTEELSRSEFLDLLQGGAEIGGSQLREGIDVLLGVARNPGQVIGRGPKPESLSVAESLGRHLERPAIERVPAEILGDPLNFIPLGAAGKVLRPLGRVREAVRGVTGAAEVAEPVLREAVEQGSRELVEQAPDVLRQVDEPLASPPVKPGGVIEEVIQQLPGMSPEWLRSPTGQRWLTLRELPIKSPAERAEYNRLQQEGLESIMTPEETQAFRAETAADLAEEQRVDLLDEALEEADELPVIDDVGPPAETFPEIEDVGSPLELARRELDEAQAHFEAISTRGAPVPKFGTPERAAFDAARRNAASEGGRVVPLRQQRTEASQRLSQAREQLRVEENAFAGDQMRAADISESMPEATRLFPRGPRLTDFRIADEPISLKPTGEIIEGGLQEVLAQFRQVLNDPQRAEEWRATLLSRGQELGRRSANMRDRANALVSEGVPTEEAINIATRELAGELPSAQTPLHALATPYVREALFQEVYTQLVDEPLEMRATATALAHALAGRPIPRTPGIQGGSAFARLQRVFGEDVTRAITQRRSLEEIIAFETREGLGLTRPTGPRRPFLEQPSTQVFGAARQIGPQQTFGQLPTERLLGEEPMLALPQRPLRPEPPAEPFAVRKADLRPLAQKEIDLQMFRETLGEAQAPLGLTGEERRLLDLPPDEVIKQSTMFPEGTKEQMLRYGRAVGLTVMDLGNLMRANVATVDLSYLRQQALLIPGNPVQFARSFKDALVSVFSGNYARQIDHWIKSDPDFRYYELLDIDFLRALDSKVAKDWQRAEDFIVLGGNRPIQKLAEKIPWINISGRAYVTGMNSMNWRIFKGHMRLLHRMNEEVAAGRMVLPPGKVLDINDSAKRFGAMLADFSGRGPLQGRLLGTDVDIRSAAPILNNVFFSTRLNLGRFLTPRHLWSPDKYTRQAAWKNMLTGVGTIGGTIYGGSLMGWWDTELDPRSSDFMKIRVGRTRLDPWGGFQQFAVLGWRLANSFREDNLKSASTEELSYRQPQDLVAQFGRSKLAPGISQTLMAFTGRDFIGKEFDRRDWQFWLRQNTMLAVQDVIEAYEAEGLLGVGLGATGLLGVGVTAFEEDEEKTDTSPTVPRTPTRPRSNMWQMP